MISTEQFMRYWKCRKAGYMSFHGTGEPLPETNSDVEHYRTFCESALKEEEIARFTKIQCIQFRREFCTDDLKASPDALILRKEGNDLYKFKLSTYAMNDDDFQELAFVAHVLKLRHISVKHFRIISINRQFVLEKD